MTNNLQDKIPMDKRPVREKDLQDKRTTRTKYTNFSNNNTDLQKECLNLCFFHMCSHTIFVIICSFALIDIVTLVYFIKRVYLISEQLTKLILL